LNKQHKTVRIKDIAEKAGVSASTVSAILNNSRSNIRISEGTRKKVLQIAEELEYRPNFFAKSLRTRTSYLISVIVWDITDPFYGEILKGIEEVLKKEGYQLLLTSADGLESNSCYERLKELPVDGVIVLGGPEHGIVKEQTEEQAIPHVYIGLRGNSDSSCSVTVDNYKGGAVGTEYLLSLGRSELYYVTKKRRTHDEEDRLRGFLDTVETRPAELHDHRIIETEDNFEGGYRSVITLLKENEDPACIFADDDLIALGILRALQDNDLAVPAQAALLGFDNLLISAYTHPRLSTLNQPRLRMGKEGAECLLKTIAGEAPAEPRIVLEPSLILRDSC
jgi:LacI family transcriptional regulator